MTDIILEQRIDELESTVAFQDATIQALSDVMARQQHDLDVLRGAMKLLQERVKAQGQEVVRPQSEETPPPHY